MQRGWRIGDRFITGEYEFHLCFWLQIHLKFSLNQQRKQQEHEDLELAIKMGSEPLISRAGYQVNSPSNDPSGDLSEDSFTASDAAETIKNTAQAVGQKIGQTATAMSQKITQFLDQMAQPEDHSHSRNPSQHSTHARATSQLKPEMNVDELLSVDDDAEGLYSQSFSLDFTDWFMAWDNSFVQF